MSTLHAQLKPKSVGHQTGLDLERDSTQLPRMATRHFDYSHLTSDERIRLAEELWDSVGPSEVTLSPTQAEELDRRRAHLRQYGSQGRPWREALEELKKRGG